MASSAPEMADPRPPEEPCSARSSVREENMSAMHDLGEDFFYQCPVFLNALYTESQFLSLQRINNFGRVLVYQPPSSGVKVLCGGDPYTPDDPKLKDGFYMTPSVLGGGNSALSNYLLTFFSPMQVVCGKVTVMGKLKVAAVLPAGGCGERMGVSTPKQFCSILGRPLISYTMQAFERVSWIKDIVVVVASERVDLMQSIIQKYGHKRLTVAEGGITRHRSILHGLKVLAESESLGSHLCKPDVVIIHDAVRPFVDEDILLKVTTAANEQGAAGAVCPLVSTVVASSNNGCLDYSLERAKHKASEMPQAFQFDTIFQAYLQCSDYDLDYGTECLQLALLYSKTPAKLVDGPSDLWKVTYNRDLYAAESLIKDGLSQFICLVTEMSENTVKVGFLLQDTLKSQGKQVKSISPSLCKNIGQLQVLFKGKSCYNFICINLKETGFEETEQMVDVLGSSSLPILYPVLLISVHLIESEPASFGCKLQDLAAIAALSQDAQKKNIWVYGLVIRFTEVEQQLQETIGRGAAIVTALIKDRSVALTGQLLVA